MFTYSLSLKLKGLNTPQNLTNCNFTQFFLDKLQSKFKKMFRISYFDNSGKHVNIIFFVYFREHYHPLLTSPSKLGHPVYAHIYVNSRNTVLINNYQKLLEDWIYSQLLVQSILCHILIRKSLTSFLQIPK